MFEKIFYMLNYNVNKLKKWLKNKLKVSLLNKSNKRELFLKTVNNCYFKKKKQFITFNQWYIKNLKKHKNTFSFISCYKSLVKKYLLKHFSTVITIN